MENNDYFYSRADILKKYSQLQANRLLIQILAKQICLSM